MQSDQARLRSRTREVLVRLQAELDRSSDPQTRAIVVDEMAAARQELAVRCAEAHARDVARLRPDYR